MLPPASCLANATTSICSRFVHSSYCKDRCPVNVVCWTPEGRRLVAGGNNGMFTMWSGMNFTFETTQQAHETAVRSMVWSHAGEWMISADHGGIIKCVGHSAALHTRIGHPGGTSRARARLPRSSRRVNV